VITALTSTIPITLAQSALSKFTESRPAIGWKRQQYRLLPCSYFLLTFTLPAGLRQLTWKHQNILMDLVACRGATVLTLTDDPKWLGATPTSGGAHTWTRAMLYHPQHHLLVSAGGYRKQTSPGGTQTFHLLASVHAM